VSAALDDLTQRARRAGQHAARLEGLGETEAAHAALAILREAGLTHWTVPSRDGGADTGGLADASHVSVRALCAIRGELAYSSGMLDVMFVMQGLGSHPLVLGANEKLRADVLPAVARGERIAAFALTEPDAGSSLGDIATRAEKTNRGWKLDGQKTFISNAGIAGFYTVLARTAGAPDLTRTADAPGLAGTADAPGLTRTADAPRDRSISGGERGLSMFYVPADARGLEITRFEVTAPHPIGDVLFHDVEVPADHLLGVEGGGLEIALATLACFRTSVAAAATGFARRAFDESRARLAARKQFGKPLASFQSLRFDAAEMDTRLRAAELLVREAAETVDAGANAVKEVARAKLFATESASWICDRAVQHFGGLGVKRGSIVERLWREVRALRIYEGTSEIQKLVLAREIFDRAP
jgi:acyl-CoA dehydrogenase